jgi:hypothetical protein
MNNAGFRFYFAKGTRSTGRGPSRNRYLLKNTNELLGRDGRRVENRSHGKSRGLSVLSAARSPEVVQ